MRLRSSLLLLVLLSLAASPAAAAEPAPPQVYLDTTMPSLVGAPTPKTVCASGCDFTSINTAVNHASVKSAGATVMRVNVTAGQTFTEDVTLPVHNNGWVIIQSSLVANLPVGSRVGPGNVANMPKIVGSGGSIGGFQTAASATNYRLIGLEVTLVPSSAAPNYGVIFIGDVSYTSLSQVPAFIYVDRCYVHGDPTQGVRRVINLHGKSSAVIDSYVSDGKEVGNDAQGIWGAHGPGPFRIVNNYIEGSTENVLFGGSDPGITNLVPSDIEIRRNLISKPLTWRVGNVSPPYAGTPWDVKNLLELKNARRVLIDGNILEYSWIGGQSGWAVLFTVRNQDGTCSWCDVSDVTFSNNIVRHTVAGFDLFGHDDSFASAQSKRIAIRNNLFIDMNPAAWGSGGSATFLGMFNAVVGLEDLIVEHNTVIRPGSGGHIVNISGPASNGFIYRYNLSSYGAFGVIGDGVGPGAPTFAQYLPDAIFTSNVIWAQPGDGATYPSGNYFPAAQSDVGFVDAAGGDYRLAPSSPYRAGAANGAADGTDMGVNFAALNAAQGLQVTGVGGTVTIGGKVNF